MRKLWTGDEVSYDGKFYNFEDVDIHPSPLGRASIPIWYCGNSPASVRRAVEYCDGWMPGRITLKTFAKRVERMRELAEQAWQADADPAAIPITSPGPTREEALAQGELARDDGAGDQGRMGAARLRRLGDGPDDLEGALIAGPPEHIIAETRKYHEAGLEHMVYDLRFRFDDWYECMQLLGEEVLPELRRGDREATTTTGARA